MEYDPHEREFRSEETHDTDEKISRRDFLEKSMGIGALGTVIFLVGNSVWCAMNTIDRLQQNREKTAKIDEHVRKLHESISNFKLVNDEYLAKIEKDLAKADAFLSKSFLREKTPEVDEYYSSPLMVSLTECQRLIDTMKKMRAQQAGEKPMP